MKTKYSFISRDQEHDYQYASKTRASQAAQIAFIVTGRPHQIFLTTTYRDLEPRICWAVVLKLAWQNGELATC